MNRERLILLLLAFIGAYFLGYFQITPQSLASSFGGKPTQAAPTAKAQKALAPPVPSSSAATAEAQPTPWPAPPDWSGR